ncbi:Pleckstrin domain-containing family A member 8 [Cytospora mali]|uniref:Pleckstrin domain-containing family A member 8 n=1 Tax=Cytospora mali TaxID=578113 RepID=A0A194VI62_CYTMA|nr:Pleckstrin domain-containing family A member 8 [Valsa mali]
MLSLNNKPQSNRLTAPRHTIRYDNPCSSSSSSSSYTTTTTDLLGATTFAMVKNDMNGNITKINQRYTEATAESATLQELVVNELKTKKHIATEGLLWLTRGLEFMCLALNANVNNKTEELSTSFRNAYGTTLKPHHSFVVKPLFSAAMSACPARADFYKKLGDDDAKVQELMAGYLASLDKIVGILKAFVTSKEAKW